MGGSASSHNQPRSATLERIKNMFPGYGVAATPVGNQIEDVPERFDGADVTWILARVCARVEHFRAPKSAG